MVNFPRRKLNKSIVFNILSRPWLVFILILVLVFVSYRELFQYYFEADEWFHFTYYFPLTRQPDGLLTALLSTITNSGPLSGGQHVIPVASLIYFLNTKFFGLIYEPYAFMSLLLHTVNTFLVFFLINTLLKRKDEKERNIYALLGALFFALAPTPMHTITGAAPFYGQNILSVTFFLLCVLFFKFSFIKGKEKYVYYSIVFLFLALFTKETSVFLFLLLPIMALLEKRVFSFKFLGKIFLLSLVIYSIFRFLIPNFYLIPEKISDILFKGYVPKSYSQPTKLTDTGTIVSRDLSFHKNLPAELLNRTLTFPIRMTGTLFLPRQTTFSIVEFITPIVHPLPDSQSRLNFLYGPGNFIVIYLVGIGIIIFCLRSILKSLNRGHLQEVRTISTALAIIAFGALPLVAIIFSFPRWGYDFYFDSRFYYNTNVGAAILFPFLIFGIGKFIYRLLKAKSFYAVILIVLLVWLINNIYVFGLTKKQFINVYGSDRREIVGQLKAYLPELKDKTVFYFETDGQSAYGPSLPFQTSIPQALSLVYYDVSPLPDSFFNKPVLSGKAQGYQFEDNRGFGYYTSKEELLKAVRSNLFSTDDVYGFYYYGKQAKLKDITVDLRKELNTK